MGVRNLQTQYHTQSRHLQNAVNQRSMDQETISRTFNNRIDNLQKAQQLAEGAQNQRRIQRKGSVEEPIANLHATLQGIHDRVDGLQQAQQQAEGAQNRRLIQHRNSLQEPIANLQASQQRLEYKVDIITATQIARTAEQEVQGSVFQPTAAEPAAKLSNGLSTKSLTHIALPVAAERCEGKCTCICHHRTARRTPSLLQVFLGSLFLGYCGIPIITPACDNAECITGSSSMVIFMYTFPAWLLARAFLFVMRLSSSRGLEFNIRLPRVISISSIIWRYLREGNIDSIKRLLQRRMSSPYVMESTSGVTALMVRLGYPMVLSTMYTTDFTCLSMPWNTNI